ncbi:hypothetical protein L210DRAFT_3539007 [Boletus edulis BED1]|uniref:PIN domain-containing protein n=1 Tax=Boletus edulis BED1 TaxID=1328754 RepID=A0AAD4BVV2_BOLED|nr:hypothetical protein L210DRAFT_3539007 [Boletus edulis BED1]
MDIDVDDAEADESSEGEDEEDSEEVKALKCKLNDLHARRRYLRSLLASAQRLPPSSSIPRSKRHPRRSTAPTLNVVPGYSTSSIIESLRWTVVIPMPVIMELDGLCSNTSQLGETAQEAIAYITSHIRSHAMSLKQVEFSNEASWDQCMDDLILKAAIWQDEHWVDWSALLKVGAALTLLVPTVDEKGQLH